MEVKMYCAGCGKNRTVPNWAADPGPCSCGVTLRVSSKLLTPRPVTTVGAPVTITFDHTRPQT